MVKVAPKVVASKPKKAKVEGAAAKAAAKAVAVSATSSNVKVEKDLQLPDFALSHHCKIQKAVATLKAKWEGVEMLPPLGVGDGGSQAAFNAQEAVTALASPSQTYKCGGNLFFHNTLASLSYQTPVNAGQVAEIMKFHFKPGSVASIFPFELVVAVSAHETSSTKNLLDAMGKFERLSRRAHPCFVAGG